MPVRDYKQYTHEDEIHMNPGDVHDPYASVPADYPSDLDSALAAVAKQDVSLTGGPRGKLPGPGR